MDTNWTGNKVRVGVEEQWPIWLIDAPHYQVTRTVFKFVNI